MKRNLELLQILIYQWEGLIGIFLSPVTGEGEDKKLGKVKFYP